MLLIKYLMTSLSSYMKSREESIVGTFLHSSRFGGDVFSVFDWSAFCLSPSIGTSEEPVFITVQMIDYIEFISTRHMDYLVDHPLSTTFVLCL